MLLTVLVAKLYPYQALFAVPCDHKGADPYATARLASFLEQSGVHQITYLCDQERALVTMTNDALRHLNVVGSWAGAIPEKGRRGRGWHLSI